VRPFSADTRDATAAKLPGILVVHENRGLNPHIEDIARRFALANFMAFAPDALTSVRAIRATMPRVASCSARSTAGRRRKISWPPRCG